MVKFIGDPLVHPTNNNAYTILFFFGPFLTQNISLEKILSVLYQLLDDVLTYISNVCQRKGNLSF